MLIEAKRTPVSIRDYTHAVLRAWRSIGEGVPSKATVAVLWAQYMIETGGSASWNWNIGNVKHVPGDGYDHHMLRGVWEGVRKTEADALIQSGQATLDTNPDHIKAVAPRVSVVFQPPHPATRFRAYPSLSDAMTHHLVFIKKRYNAAWEQVLMGDYRAFASALKAGRDGIEGTSDDYFTASSAAYANGMKHSFITFVASDVYDQELTTYLSAMDTPTTRGAADAATIPAPVPETRPDPFGHIQIVHPRVPLGRPTLDDHDDPDELDGFEVSIPEDDDKA